MVTAPQTSLKVIVIVHFLLTVWASMNFLPTSYIYMNAFILAFGFWAIVSADSIDAILMFSILNLISIAMDIIFIAIRASHPHPVAYGVNEYRFSLGMAIVNLLIKPFTTFVLYRLYQERAGQYSQFGIPGVTTSFGSSQSGQQGTYENIDQPVPGNPTETAAPHGFDRQVLP